jgi:hypothetical protein
MRKLHRKPNSLLARGRKIDMDENGFDGQGVSPLQVSTPIAEHLPIRPLLPADIDGGQCSPLGSAHLLRPVDQGTDIGAGRLQMGEPGVLDWVKVREVTGVFSSQAASIPAVDDLLRTLRQSSLPVSESRAVSLRCFWPAVAAVTFLDVLSIWAIVTGGLLLAAARRLSQTRGRWVLAFAGAVSTGWGILLATFGPNATDEPGRTAVWLLAYTVLFGVTLIALGVHLRRQHHRSADLAARGWRDGRVTSEATRP